MGGVGIVALLVAGCSLASPTPSTGPAASVQLATGECSAVDIRAPSGTRVELTVVWRSNDLGVYNINQDGSCIYWMGMSHDPGSTPGEFWTNVFIGTVLSDFTVVGRWGDVPYPAEEVCQVLCDRLGRGTMSLLIDFDQSGEVERPVLRAVDESGGFGGSVWVLARRGGLS